MLIDEVDITIRAGHGGPGKVSFDGRGPDGGNGGRGGDVIIKPTSDLTALNQFSAKTSISASDGEPGTNRRSHGKKGTDVTLYMPMGTMLLDKDTGESWELSRIDQEILICKGGLGGRGNLEFKSGKRRTPTYAQKGLEGDYRKLKVNLRYIADIGLIGLPNAGKSSLLNMFTNARAIVGAYPFTTLEANLGAFGQKIIADIPGLIEGASKGKGLGIKFLKHIEKVKLLVHCISAESVDVMADYATVNHELEKYSTELLTKTRIILLTKSDLVDEITLKRYLVLLKELDVPVYPVSIYDSSSIEIIAKHLKLAD